MRTIYKPGSISHFDFFKLPSIAEKHVFDIIPPTCIDFGQLTEHYRDGRTLFKAS